MLIVPMMKGPLVAETTDGRPSKRLTERMTVPSLLSVRPRQPRTEARTRRVRTVALRVIRSSRQSKLDHPRRDEDQQLVVLLVPGLVLEQVADDRDVGQPRYPVLSLVQRD